MAEVSPQWQLKPSVQPPAWVVQAVQNYAPDLSGEVAAQLLWQRGICDPETLVGFLDSQRYQPASPMAFGEEMRWAVNRLLLARDRGEKVAIWGDFDADGITATSVLWEGLGQFFPQHEQLTYHIPNRLTESHGLNERGIAQLHQQGYQLIVTCDTGSTNLAEMQQLQALGIDLIVTDHHTLLPERPPVVAIINPRSLPDTHPLFHLSGVAVAYKLVEALYEALPEGPQQPVEHLLDLVAIGLIADLVALQRDCRYLAQQGIERLQRHVQPNATNVACRPGVKRLLELCKRSGDRPTDISFGLGPRINAVSRIQGDASFCVELLTSRDGQRCQQLALETELANARRKALQRDVQQQAEEKLQQLDLSTTYAIVLAEPQWPAGVLGLVAGQIAQTYGRPTILLSTDAAVPAPVLGEEIATVSAADPPMARGSARSVNQIDLYQLVNSQAHLLHRFGGHPFAAGLSLPVENIPLFAAGLNRQLGQQLSEGGGLALAPVVEADLQVQVADLGRDLFRELKLLEPCGMGNPVPKLLIQNCWFRNPFNANIRDSKGGKVRYIKTEFELWDKSMQAGFPGIWWGHYVDELPSGHCDVVVELDFNAYKKRYEARLQAVRPVASEQSGLQNWLNLDIRDWRDRTIDASPEALDKVVQIAQCPTNWGQLRRWLQPALVENSPVALCWPGSDAVAKPDGEASASALVWKQLVGIAKYLSRTECQIPLQKLQAALEISDRAFVMGLQALMSVGFAISSEGDYLEISGPKPSESSEQSQEAAIVRFLNAVEEDRFHRRYFATVPLATIQAMVARNELDAIAPIEAMQELRSHCIASRLIRD